MLPRRFGVSSFVVFILLSQVSFALPSFYQAVDLAWHSMDVLALVSLLYLQSFSVSRLTRSTSQFNGKASSRSRKSDNCKSTQMHSSNTEAVQMENASTGRQSQVNKQTYAQAAI